MPRVSVVTCTYNRAHLIGETIRSVLSQTFGDFEYIIVDDGSTDDTAAVVEAFADPRIRYYRHERTGGHLSRLRNFSHEQCAGEFVAYVDSDDIWEPDKLEIQLSGLADDPSVGFSFTDVDLFDANGLIRSSIYGKNGTYTGSVFDDMLFNRMVICHTALLLRRSCLAMTGPMDESLHSGDHDLVLFLSRYFNAFVVYWPLVHVRKHSQNSTGSHALNLRLLQEALRSLEKLLQQQLITVAAYKAASGKMCYDFGVQLLRAADHDAASAYFMKSLRMRPWFWKTWVRVAMVLPRVMLSPKKIVGA